MGKINGMPRHNYLTIFSGGGLIPGSKFCVLFMCFWYKCEAVLTVLSHSLIESAFVDWLGKYCGVIKYASWFRRPGGSEGQEGQL